MRASRYLRQRAAQRSIGYNLAVLVNDVMPQIVNTMWTMHSTQKIQLRTLSRALDSDPQPSDPSTRGNEHERFAVIEAAVRAIVPNVQNETAAWNTWNNLASNEDFRRAIVMIDSERRWDEHERAHKPSDP